MPFSAFLLVAIAAIAHSTWNLLAKRAAHSKHVIWFSSMGETVLFLPVVVRVVRSSSSTPGWKAAVFLCATGLLHILYFEALQQGYRVGDLSVVYPLARGTGPLLSFFGAILVLGEHPSLLASCGAFLVTGGVIYISGGFSALRNRANRAGLFWGIATGLTIACYTLTDGYSVKALLISPFLVEYAGCVFRLVVLSARGWRERDLIRSEYRLYRREALGISILLPAGYILVLFAMRLAPVSHVAPVREMSMLIAAWFGVRLLREGNMARRLTGSFLIASGVAALALG